MVQASVGNNHLMAGTSIKETQHCESDPNQCRIRPVHFGEEDYCMYAKGYELSPFTQESNAIAELTVHTCVAVTNPGCMSINDRWWYGRVCTSEYCVDLNCA